jgi:hypothetical protein
MKTLTTYPFAVIVIIYAVLMMQMNSSEGGRKRKRCQFNKEHTECVDIIPKRAMKFKICPNFDIATRGRCAKIGGYCTIIPRGGKNRCICDKHR